MEIIHTNFFLEHKMNEFIYNDKVKAEQDLKLFSNMNCQEDKPLYLINVGTKGFVIHADVFAINIDGLEAIALNGRIFRA